MFRVIRFYRLGLDNGFKCKKHRRILETEFRHFSKCYSFTDSGPVTFNFYLKEVRILYRY